jgi:hypothetical protein
MSFLLSHTNIETGTNDRQARQIRLPQTGEMNQPNSQVR